MRPIDAALALLVTLVWGIAFVVTRTALDSLSPPLLMTLRFALSALPVLVVPRPAIGLPMLAAIGATLFLGQFLFQFIGIARGVPPGLAAVIVQSQALFTVAFAAALFGQMPRRRQMAGLMLAAGGLLAIAATSGAEFSFVAFLLILVSPVSFAFGNILMKRAGPVDMVALVAWASLVPPLPGLALALATEGPAGISAALSATSAAGWLSTLYLGFAATTLGYAVWGRLIARYSAATIAPFALLVPFVGAGASALVFGETFGPLRLAGMALVLGGLGLLLTARPPAGLSR